MKKEHDRGVSFGSKQDRETDPRSSTCAIHISPGLTGEQILEHARDRYIWIAGTPTWKIPIFHDNSEAHRGNS